MKRGVILPRPHCPCCGVRYVAVTRCAAGVRFENRCRVCIEENVRVRDEAEIRTDLAAQLGAAYARWAALLAQPIGDGQ